ncbi:MAG TPA: chitinase [Gaiellaceae bacterium]|nr:chitinase [Gaiellaceae bacterium]
MSRRLSLPRLALVVLATAALGATAAAVYARSSDVSPATLPGWYAPYVDATNTPEVQFQDPGQNPSNAVVLGFVVASATGACTPTWGTYYTLAGAARALDLDRRIARLRQRGGGVLVSFGGVANDDLAERCDVAGLTDAYRRVVDRYRLTAIDLDVEGAALADTAGGERRAKALAAFQRLRPNVAIWLTVPVAPDGLPDAALVAVRQILRAKVKVAGVNAMTMDYGDPAASDLVASSERALQATAAQLTALYARLRQHLTPAVWHRIGMTVMIGQNDTPDEVLSLDDAQRLVRFARERGVGRVSMWSLNRDQQCGAQVGSATVSTVCSGVAQAPLAFSQIFDQLQQPLQPPLRTAGGGVSSSPRDDPATSPDPIWHAKTIYRVGDKVTWHHSVFQAKWYTQGDLPDAPVEHEWDSPWLLLGPVLPGDRPLPKKAKPRVATAASGAPASP